MSSLDDMLSDIEQVLETSSATLDKQSVREKATIVLTGENAPDEWIHHATHRATQSDLFRDPLLQRAYFGLVCNKTINSDTHAKNHG